MNISMARFTIIVRYSLYLIISLLALSGCKTKENEPVDLAEVIKTREPLQRDTDIPLSLSMGLEEDRTTLRGLPLMGNAPDSPEYAPVRDWSQYDWESDISKPHILIAISNARHPNPTGGVYEIFKKLKKEEGSIELKIIDGRTKPHITIESHVTIPKGMKVDEFQVAVLVVDRGFGSLNSFEQNGTISFDFSHECYDISKEAKEFQNLVFAMEPVAIKEHMGKANIDTRVKDTSFKLASTILVMEFADPENKGGADPYLHVDLESDGFTNKGALSMSGIGNPKAYQLTTANPLTQQIANVFSVSNPSITAKRYARYVTMVLPTKGNEQTYKIKAIYKNDSGRVSHAREYKDPKLKDTNKYAGKILFVDFEIEEAPLDKAKYFQTVWNSGDDGKIAFYVAGIYPREDPKIASTHKAKIYYRKSNSTPSTPWKSIKVKDISNFRGQTHYDVVLENLEANTNYDIWMKNLSYFSVTSYWDNYLNPDRPDLQRINNWGSSNEWGRMEMLSADPYLTLESPLRFNCAVNLEITATDLPNFKYLINAKGMFQRTQKFNGSPNINKWDMSSVEDMSLMFREATGFNADISEWNVSNVTGMSAMFDNAHSFNQNISNWDVSRVTDMSAMFTNAINFNQDLLWGENFRNVTSTHGMFFGAEKFNGNISNWDTSSLNNISLMFDGASSFNQSLGGWKKIHKIKDLRLVFSRSGMTEANIQATLEGWKTTAEGDPDAIRGVKYTKDRNDSWNWKSNPTITGILDWFRNNREWYIVEY